MNKDLFDGLRQGLEEAVAHSKNELALKTVIYDKDNNRKVIYTSGNNVKDDSIQEV